MIDTYEKPSPGCRKGIAHGRRAVRQSGFSLIELMIAITISLVIVAALVTLFVNFTRSNTELAKTNIKIENGRIAMQILQNDIVHAGFWGNLGFYQPTADEPLAYPSGYALPTAIPNPCLAVASWDDSYKKNLLAIPVLGFANGSTLGGCNVTGVDANSDVLVVSHANTCTLGSAGCEGGTDSGPHIQVSACRSGSELPYVIAPKGSAAFTLTQKNCVTPVAEFRKIISRIYYVASINGVPTLMRVSLENGAWSQPQPLIEGIEAFRVEYGIDSLGRNGLAINLAALPPNYGDGSADVFVSCPHFDTATPPVLTPCSMDELSNVVAVKIHVLARNLEPTTGYTDSKSYQLGATAISAKNDNFKRHVFSTTVRLVNPSARREVQ